MANASELYPTKSGEERRPASDSNPECDICQLNDIQLVRFAENVCLNLESSPDLRQ